MIKTKDYNSLVQKLREFFLHKGFVEVPVQSRLTILAACEDPFTVEQFNWNDKVWPLPQTGQMWLEYELLKNPDFPGVFVLVPHIEMNQTQFQVDMKRFFLCLNSKQKVL